MDCDDGNDRVKTETLDEGANSTLSVARVNKSDSGNYSCSINASHVYSVSIHVLTGKLSYDSYGNHIQFIKFFFYFFFLVCI